MSKRICPWWLGYLLVSPLRRMLQDPDTILSGYVREGMKVMDIGCGMGFFSLPLAAMVGARGKVYAIDVQEKMISGLLRRAKKNFLVERIDARVSSDHLPLKDQSGAIDFSLAFAVMHEVPDQERLLIDMYRALKKGGTLLLAEPRGHVKLSDFEKTLALAMRAGFEETARPEISRSHAALLRKL